jgi:hypothetical protein
MAILHAVRLIGTEHRQGGREKHSPPWEGDCMHPWSTRIRARYVFLLAFVATIATIGWTSAIVTIFAGE